MSTVIHVEGLFFKEFEGQTRFSAIITDEEFKLADCDKQYNHLFTINTDSPTCRNFSHEENHQKKCEFVVHEFVNRGFKKEGCPFYIRMPKGWCTLFPVKIINN